MERRKKHLSDYRATEDRLLSAETLAEYQAAVATLRESPLVGIPEVSVCRDLSLGTDGSRALMVELICGASVAMASYIESPLAEPFLPEELTEREADAYSLFRNDKAIGNNHNRYRFYFDAAKSDFVEWLVDGTLNLDGGKIGWRTVRVFHSNDVGRTGFSFREKEFGILGGQSYIGSEERKPVVSSEFVGKATETSVCYELELHRLFDASGKRFTQTLLKTLDQLKEHEDGHPLFRAFTFIHLVDLMRDRPVEWGLSFCPNLHEDVGYLRKAIGPAVKTGDWYRKQVSAEQRKRIDDAFRGMRDASYEQQATGLLKVYGRCFQRGLKFVGYLSIAGTPMFRAGRTPLDHQLIWSIDKKGSPVAAMRLDNGVTKMLVDRVPPMSPLLVYDGNLAQTIAEAGVDGDLPEFAAVLPAVLE